MTDNLVFIGKLPFSVPTTVVKLTQGQDGQACWRLRKV